MEQETSALFVISLFFNLILGIALIAANNKKDKLNRTIKLMVKGAGFGKQKELFEKLTWYAKRTALYRMRYRNYEKALQDYHSKYRTNSLPTSYDDCSFAELCDSLVDRKILGSNYFRNSLSEPESLSLSETLKELIEVKNEKSEILSGS